MGFYLDVHAVEAFLKVSELKSFTLAAEALCLTQAGVTVRIQRLEKTIGSPLFHRTPRQVYLSDVGESFLPKAKGFMEAHHIAVRSISMPSTHRILRIGISDHVLDHELITVIQKLRSTFREYLISFVIDASTSLLKRFESKEYDIVVVTQDGNKKAGDLVRKDVYHWYGQKGQIFNNAIIPLITLKDSCRLRELVIELLLSTGLEWYDSFQGGGVAAVVDAVKAGFGVAALPERLIMQPDLYEMVDVSQDLNLPLLPVADVVVYDNCIDPIAREVLKSFIEFLKAASSSPAPHAPSLSFPNLSRRSYSTLKISSNS